MGGYIQLDKDLEDDERVLELTDLLLDEWEEQGVAAELREQLRDSAGNAVLGGLYKLWRYADTHLKRYDRLNLALHGVARVTGFSVTLLSNFPESWLVVHDDGTIELPGYSDKNALITKDNRREKTRDRVRRWRQRQRNPQPSESNALLKRAGNTEIVTGALPPGPGPGPYPNPDPPRPGSEVRNPEVSAGGHASAGELASAPDGRLARRVTPVARKPPKRTGPTKTPDQLREDSRRLRANGMAADAIAHSLQQYGVTLDQVTEWLAA